MSVRSLITRVHTHDRTTRMNIPRILLLTLLAIAAHASAQELPDIRPRHANGLIYDESAMARLRAVVDSLHATFDPEGRVRRDTMRQGVGRFIGFELPTGDPESDRRVAALLAELAEGVPPESMVEPYADVILGVEQLDPVVLSRCGIATERRREWRQGSCFGIGARLHFVRDTMLATHPPRAGQWAVDTMWEGSRISVRALYVDEAFVDHVLPDEYARLVRYAEHLLRPTRLWINDEADTTDALIDGLSRALRAMFAMPDDIPPGVMAVVYDGANPEGVRRYVADPAYDSALAMRKRTWMPVIERLLRPVPASVARYATLRSDSIAACPDRACVDAYIERAVSAELAMELYRRVRPEGMIESRCYRCSEDAVPRFHDAEELARLAALAGRWDLFLSASLAAIDAAGWIAYGDGMMEAARSGNMTNRPELEATGLRLDDLLIGIALGGGGDVRQIGLYGGRDGVPEFAPAFVEAVDAPRLMERLRSMILDDRLGPEQRADLFNLYLASLDALPDGGERIAAVVADAAAYPLYLRDEIGEMGVMGEGE